MSWSDGRLLGFDTETTGVNTAQARLVTAAIVVRDGGQDQTVTWLADPQVEIPQAAQRVHGISTEYARENGSPARQVLAEVADMLVEQLHEGLPVVAFNAPFDLALMEAELARHNLPTLRERLGQLSPIVDPYVLDRYCWRYRKGKRTLSATLPAYGLTVAQDMHTAEVDVRATLDLAQAIAARYPKVAQMEPGELHAHQVQWAKELEDSYAAFLRSRGRTPRPRGPWPI